VLERAAGTLRHDTRTRGRANCAINSSAVARWLAQ
jgi:hypothetical protein